MSIRNADGVDWAAYDEEQTRLSCLVSSSDAIDIDQIHRIGGVDIQWDDDGFTGVAALVVLSWPDLTLIHTQTVSGQSAVPYRAGYLGIRECPLYQRLIQDVRQTQFAPDVVLVDGFGVLHPRGAGSATQLGVTTDTPTIGVGKTLLYNCATATEADVKNVLNDPHITSCPLVNSAGIMVGSAIKKPGSRTPVYVSVGHKVSLQTAVDIVTRTFRYVIPEPIRLADQAARAAIRAKNKPLKPKAQRNQQKC